jgi:hypothetical protein
MEVFVTVHKGLRRGLLEHSLRLSGLDWSNEREVKAAGEDFTNLLRFLRLHGNDEDRVQFPLAATKDPESVLKSQEDHRRLEHELNLLEIYWEEVSAHPEKNLGNDFYRTYNRYLSDYLHHMDREEGEVTDSLHRHYTDTELDAEFSRMVEGISSKDMGMMLGYILPSMNPKERRDFLSKLKRNGPPPVFEQVKELAQRILPQNEWENLAGMAG